jgi:hypothetical protein
VTLLDDEVVNDTDCYVLKFELDFKKLLEYLMSQITMDELGIPGFENQDVMDNDEIEDAINMMNMSTTEWIAKDTYLVMKAEATLEMTTTSPDTEEEATIAIDFNMTFYDYNVPVSIVLPPEVEDATDISDVFGILPGENEKDIPQLFMTTVYFTFFTGP